MLLNVIGEDDVPPSELEENIGANSLGAEENMVDPTDRAKEVALYPTRFLFWNLKKQVTGADVAELANSLNADVVLLAETGWNSAKSLNTRADFDTAFASYPPESGHPEYRLVEESETEKVAIYTRLKQHRQMKPNTKGTHYVIWEVRTDSDNQLLLAACHFPAYQTDQGDAQRAVCFELRRDLERAEQERSRSPKKEAGQIAKLRFRGSVVLGDLNAPPWAPGLVATYGLHATHLRRGSTSAPRLFMGKRHPWLYNPMWRFLHPAPNEANGTYYLRGPGAVGYEWHVLDQVLIRPSLLDFFKEEELQILMELNKKNILDPTEKPDQNRYSDHLPLVFNLYQ